MMKFSGKVSIASQEVCHGKTVTLRLKHSAFLYQSELADGTVDGRNEIGRRQRTDTWLEWTGKKVIEGAIAPKIGLSRLVQIHPIFADKPAEQRGNDPAVFNTRDTPGHFREQPLWNQIIKKCADQSSGFPPVTAIVAPEM